ncbi:MAG: 4-hydroxythreonine-4-phosphate dehydrogenase [Helicobacteraceae bacterium]
MLKPRIAVSVGDLGGIGIELALRYHKDFLSLARPVYLISKDLLAQAADLLGVDLPQMDTEGEFKSFKITPGKVSASAGGASFESFRQALDLADAKQASGVLTLPVSKEAWQKAGANYKGHTDYLGARYNQTPIMMLGCDKLFVGLFTDHLPLKDVPASIQRKPLAQKLYDFCRCTGAKEVACLGLNPHAGENGLLGSEDAIINAAIKDANSRLRGCKICGAFPPDSAFSPAMRARFKYYFAMYHDGGLAPLKALFFDESINVSLNLPVRRASVDHGTAFDIAYKGKNPSPLSYINAIRFLAAC